MNEQYQRMSDKTFEPTEQDMLNTIGVGAAAAWKEIHAFFRANYDHMPIKKHWGESWAG